MPRSEKSRRRDRQRVKRWRRNNRDRYRATQRRTWKKNAARYNQQRAAKRARDKRDRQQFYDAGLSVTTGHDRLLYIDHHGLLHTEEELSAEELIRRYQSKQRKEGPQ